MKEALTNSSRDQLLAAVRNVQQRTAVVSEPYQKEAIYFQPSSLLGAFSEELQAVAGQCVVCESEAALYSSLAQLIQQREWTYVVSYDASIREKLSAMDVEVRTSEADFTAMPAAITACEALVARTGSVVMSSKPEIGRQLYAFAPVHIVVAYENQLVAFPEEALLLMQSRYPGGLPSAISFVTGPSRTADIEKTLVLGSHGPKELIIFVLKS
jgi:L-lactate dehydrogenase complex protein LldG